MSHPQPRLDDGAWLAYLEHGERAGEGGDVYTVRYFGTSLDAEIKALHFANNHRGYKAVLVAPGESILDAEKHRD